MGNNESANPSPAQEEEPLEIGDQVRHPKWGVGTILYKSGSGEQMKLIVVFPEEGQKKLLAKYAKLKKVTEPPHDEESGENEQD